MLLTGHAAEVFSMKFNPEGDTIASGSHDKGIFLWRVYGDCENYMVLRGKSLLIVSYFAGKGSPFLRTVDM